MKLRTRGDGASSSKVEVIAGNMNPEYIDVSDDDPGMIDLDADYNALSNEDSEKEAVMEIGDDDFGVPSVSKRMKRDSSKKRGEQSHEVENGGMEEEGERDTDRIIREEVEGNMLGFDFSGVVEDMREVRKKKSKKKKEDRPILMWEVLEQENERWVAENLAKDIDLSNQNDMVAETVDPPSELIMPLLRYQKEWLAWSLKQEESIIRGGILADEMGMGKTVQAISLVLAKREISRAAFGNELPSSSTSSTTKFPIIKGTLVICPVVAVMQWVSEIERFTSKGSTKVLVYHGANRERNIYQFSEYDFVITTYSIVEADYRKYMMPPKEKCQWCGKLFYDHKLKIHLKYFCGPGAERTDKQSKQKRKDYKQKKTSDSVVVTKKRNPKKDRKHNDGEKDMGNGGLIETSAPSGQFLPLGKSILHSVEWNRIILDEAHFIKDRRSNTTRAVLALQSSYKWALSGTPLQNRVGELYSLVRFLQIVPYSYYFCKDCDCRSLDYSTSTDCPHCPHKAVRHFCWWNRYVSTPIQNYGNSGPGRDAMILLKHKILKSIVLRRTKKGRAADLALPPRIVNLRRHTLDIREDDYYTAMYNESQAQFNTFVEAGTVMNNYAHIFDLLTRLRQAVDHPYLVEYSLTAMERKGKAVDTSNGEQCSLCHDLVEDPVVTSCAHVFCKSCLIDYSASKGQASCPLCSKPLTVDFTANKDSKEQNARTTIRGFRSSSILNRIQLNDFQTSTKIDALREEIRNMVERDGSAKGIVFSQFTSFLDLIHYSLEKVWHVLVWFCCHSCIKERKLDLCVSLQSGVNCVQLDGSMSLGARDTAIKKFTEDPDCRIFLMSLKAGGVALNLTVASNVFLMDPWWNPAVERQAQDRIHRIGQYKPIRIVRFIIENTVEERILKLQEKKELVFEGTVGGSSEALAKLTEADMKFLFVT
ncbi:DNA repair RAD16-like [Olea europaea subsp. europaea]|uniref:DNA repair RAD16-like n=1 Tax=Olea europaea subsp. europaea TaxID=158383 RepID=A0A8S0PEZ2_OLEEU|nr:DNA repair RAD16-like [Olea europaea subsp. europaea]